MHGPFPDMQIVPSGGVGLDDADAWIAAGAPAVSVGGPLLGDAFKGGDLEALTQRARQLTIRGREGARRAKGRAMNEHSAPDVVTLGETMALIRATHPGPLQHASEMTLGMGGSESNFAIALRRLGTTVTWVGRVGVDSFGEYIRRELTAEQVDACIVADSTAPTGLMIKERRTASTQKVWYYRAGSAGSRLSPRTFRSKRSAALAYCTSPESRPRCPSRPLRPSTVRSR